MSLLTRRAAVLVMAGALACTLGCKDDDVRRQGWRAITGSQDYGWLLSAWGPDGGDVFMVGGPATEGRIVRFDGGSFSQETIPAVPRLNWVFGFSATNIYAVGDGGTVLHYDGSAWTQQTTGVTEALWGVWGAAPDDIWAVGGRGSADATATMLHYDGMGWTEVTLPTIVRPGVRALFKVWGTSADHVFAVGQNGVILHYDGMDWTEQSAGTGEDLIALWGTGPNEIVAVGGRGNAVAAVWDGTDWTSQSLAPLPGLNGVWMRAPGIAHVVGVQGTAGLYDLSANTIREDVPNTLLDLHAVFGTSDGRLIAVGGNFDAAPEDAEGRAFSRGLGNDE